MYTLQIVLAVLSLVKFMSITLKPAFDGKNQSTKIIEKAGVHIDILNKLASKEAVLNKTLTCNFLVLSLLRWPDTIERKPTVLKSAKGFL